MTEVASINNWIPVIGTLSGAAIGLLASFLIAYFNKSSEELKAKNDRDRARIEKIYELLITVKSENLHDFGKIINWVHYTVPVANKENMGIPPLVELDMLINLYFPDLKSDQEDLMLAVQKFGASFLEARQTDYRKKSTPEKQSDSGKLFSMSESIALEISNMQARLAQRVKA